MTGLRQAVWVPVENLIFAVVKIILLFASSVIEHGVLLSWINSPGDEADPGEPANFPFSGSQTHQRFIARSTSV